MYFPIIEYEKKICETCDLGMPDIKRILSLMINEDYGGFIFKPFFISVPLEKSLVTNLEFSPLLTA